MKRLIVLLAAGLGLLACTKEAPVADTATQPLKFNITVTHPDGAATKAVKTGWEDNDVVYVFFSEAAAPKYLEMKYDAETDSWTNTQKNGTAEEAFDLTEGTMTAVFLPFGSDAEVGADDDGNFTFNKMYYCYYLAAEKQAYSVEEGVVYGKLEMQLPDGFVQFFIEDDYPLAGYSLWENHVAPAGVESIAADGTVNMKVRKNGFAMPGFYYDNGTAPAGYIFSGILDEEARGTATAYTFHLAVSSDEVFVTASGTKTLYTETSRALKLPAPGFGVWETDPHPAIDLGLDVKWAMTNIGAEKPEDCGDYFAWGETTPHYESIAENGTVTWKAGMSEGYAWSTYLLKDNVEPGEGDEYLNHINKYQFADKNKKGIWYNADGDFIGDDVILLSGYDYEDDAARQNWGEPWRMPTVEEMQALFFTKTNCDWSDYDDTLHGWLVTSKIPGYEGNTLFFPAASSYDGTALFIDEDITAIAWYWASKVINWTDFASCGLLVKRTTSADVGVTSNPRYLGLPIRPVCD